MTEPRRIILKVLAFVAFIAAGAQAQEGIALNRPAEDDPRPHVGFYLKAEELARWIAENSDFAPMEEHPVYLFLTRAELQYMFRGGKEARDGVTYMAAEALYSRGVMFLADSFDPDKRPDVLLHELVHHLQYEQETEYACRGKAEKAAYKLQARYVEETGVGAAPLDPLTLMLVTECHQQW